MIPRLSSLLRVARCLVYALLGARALCGAAAGDPGELEIREVLPLTAAERARLRDLVASSEEARALLAAKRSEIAPWLDAAPRPLAVIVYEGRLNTDPARHATVRSLYDMDRCAAFLEVWQATDEAAPVERCREMIRAWASTYVPTGNDVNENKLVPLLVAYEALRPGFAETERAAVDAWLRRLAEPHREAARDTRQANNNRYAKRVRLIALAGLALGEPAWVDEATGRLRVLVDQAIFADGTSHDLKERDTLTYHTTTVRPLLDLALLAKRRDQDLYAWEAPGGGSLKKAVDHVRPYATGEKTRREWVNSKAEIDRRRAEAGIESYQAGRFFEPKQALKLMEQAELFDPTLGPVVAKLSERPEARFGSWRLVVHEAIRGAGTRE